MATEQLQTKVVTGKVRFSYLHVWEPVAINGEGDPKFSVSLIIPKNDKATLKAIKEAVENAKENGKTSKFAGRIPANLKLPLRDGDEERLDDENYKGAYFLNASAKTKPGLVDKDRKPILDQDELYSGCYGVASITFYPFNTSGNKGIACGLNHLMKLTDGEALGGRSTAENDFAEVDTAAYEEDEL